MVAFANTFQIRSLWFIPSSFLFRLTQKHFEVLLGSWTLAKEN